MKNGGFGIDFLARALAVKNKGSGSSSGGGGGVQGPAVTDGNKGDIIVSGNGTVWQLSGTLAPLYGRSLLSSNSATAARIALELGEAATRNDAFYFARGNHTGVQPISSVSGLQAALDAKASKDVFNTTTAGLVPQSPGGTNAYLRADGTWSVPPVGTGGGGGGTSTPAWVISPVTATGASQGITLPEGVDANAILVFVDGVYQDPGTHYTVAGTTLTITAPVGAKISALKPGGTTGAPGANGRSVLNGSGAPSSSLGFDGDFYINKLTYDIYGPRTNSNWGTPTSLIGQGTVQSGGSVAWTLIATSTYNGNATQTDFSNISTNYNELLIEIKNLTFSTGQRMNMRVSGNNGVTLTNVIVFPAAVGSAAIIGTINLENIRRDIITGRSAFHNQALINNVGVPGVDSANATAVIHVDGGINFIRIGGDANATFTGGTVSLYGR